MTYEEKLKLILRSIKEAEKATRKEHDLKLYVSKDSELSKINLNEAHDILSQLQDDEKIITVRELPTSLKQYVLEPTDLLSGPKDYFSIEIKGTFDAWNDS